MSDRDELAKLLGDHYGTSAGKDDYLWSMADIIIERGYRKPRTIETAEELDALGHGSVIRSEHRHYWVAHKEDGMGSDQGWAAAGGGAITSRELTSWLPATVLYEPAP